MANRQRLGGAGKGAACSLTPWHPEGTDQWSLLVQPEAGGDPTEAPPKPPRATEARPSPPTLPSQQTQPCTREGFSLISDVRSFSLKTQVLTGANYKQP